MPVTAARMPQPLQRRSFPDDINDVLPIVSRGIIMHSCVFLVHECQVGAGAAQKELHRFYLVLHADIDLLTGKQQGLP